MQHYCLLSSMALCMVLQATPPSKQELLSTSLNVCLFFWHIERLSWIKQEGFFPALNSYLKSAHLEEPFKHNKQQRVVNERSTLPCTGHVKSCWITDYWRLLQEGEKKKYLGKDKENWDFMLISTDFDLAIYLPNVIPASHSKSLSLKWLDCQNFIHKFIRDHL